MSGVGSGCRGGSGCGGGLSAGRGLGEGRGLGGRWPGAGRGLGGVAGSRKGSGGCRGQEGVWRGGRGQGAFPTPSAASSGLGMGVQCFPLERKGSTDLPESTHGPAWDSRFCSFHADRSEMLDQTPSQGLLSPHLTFRRRSPLGIPDSSSEGQNLCFK